jgi:hypothetical protein
MFDTDSGNRPGLEIVTPITAALLVPFFGWSVVERWWWKGFGGASLYRVFEE